MVNEFVEIFLVWGGGGGWGRWVWGWGVGGWGERGKGTGEGGFLDVLRVVAAIALVLFIDLETLN